MIKTKKTELSNSFILNIVIISVSNGPSSGNGPSSSEGASSSEPNERNSCNSPDSSSNANKTAGTYQIITYTIS